MGTDVQSKMYLPAPGYYIIRDVDDNAVDGSWNLHHETSASKSVQYYGMFLTSPSIEGYSGHDKQQMRQTILNHEVIFKNQLHELHRLYRKQQDLMNGIHCEKLYENPITVEKSQASLFSSRILYEDVKSMSRIANIPTLDFTRSTPSTLGTVSVQSPLCPMKGSIKICDSVPTRNGVRSEDFISSESRCKKLQRRLFDLEVDNEDEQLAERVFGVARMETAPLNIKHEVTSNGYVNSFLGSDVNSGCNGHSSSSNVRIWNHGLTDLNEPIQDGEDSSAASIDILRNTNCSKGELLRQGSFVISNSNIQLLSKELSQDLKNGRDGGFCLNNLPSENERRWNELSSHNSESGPSFPEKNNCDNSSVHGGSHPGHSSAPFESRKAHDPFKLPPFDRSKAELQRRRMIFGVDISRRDNDQLVLPCHTSGPSKPSHLSSINADNTRKVGSLGSDLALDSVPVKSTEKHKVENIVIEKELNNCIAGIRHHIDLNMCLNEEEAPSTPSSSTFIAKIPTAIDLDVPVVLETEEGTSCKGESLESQIKRPVESLQDELGVSHERIVRVAAEAIVTISSYCTCNPSDDTVRLQSQAPPSDSLHWFADMISSYEGDLENDGASSEKVIPQIDYFEFMTLRLTETKVEEYYYKPEAMENPKDEETLPKRPRRGQARRGKQRKDFQRDILPGIASLSRHEVTEDLQTIESIIRTTGGTWQSSLTKRNAARGSSVRGRRRSGGSAVIPTVTTVCPPLIQQADSNKSGLEERSLTGWGKRTRRPPRHRYPIVNPPLLVQ